MAWSTWACPALPPQANPAFPAWALAAAGIRVVLVATSAGRAFGLTSLPPGAWPVIAAAIADGTALAAAGRRAAGLGLRL